MVAPIATVWIVYCSQHCQYSIHVPYVEGITAWEAFEQSGLREKEDLADIPEMGVFSLKITDPKQHVLELGDRLEIYRPLTLNPKEVRRLRAQKNPVGRYRQGNQWKRQQKSTDS